MDEEKKDEVTLVGMSGAYKDRTFRLDKEDFLVGRARDCDLRMDENTISGRHARILRVQDHYEVEDLQSTNGTFLGGLRVNRKRLRSGDTIKFDQFAFQFIDPSDVSRTMVATPAALAEAQRTIHRPAPSPPAAAGTVSAPGARRGNLAAGVVVAVLIAFLVGLGGNLLLQQAVIAGGGGSLLASAWANLVSMAQSYPIMHQAHLWAQADLGRWQNVISILLVILSVILGGLAAQSLGRRNKVAAAAVFSFVFVAAAFLVQSAALKFRFESLPLFHANLFSGLSSWPAFGLGAAYIFGVVFVLSLLGALLVRRKR